VIARSKRPVAACIAFWLVAEVAVANTFVKDHREQRDSSLPIFRSVGMLVHPQAGGGGTAFLVSRCHIVTAHHVAFPAKERDVVTGNVEAPPGKVGHGAEFVIGPHPTIPGTFVARAHATVIEFGNFSSGSFDGMTGDWAILILDECLGKKFGFLKYARPGDDSPMPHGDLMAIGFPRSRAKQAGITVETGCKARDHGPVKGLVGVDCAFEAGMSGGPMLERQIDGSWLVVGLIQQSMGGTDKLLPSYSMAYRNQVVSVTAFRKALDGVLRAEGRRVLVKRTR
jgi:hypothetical protein